MHPTLVVAQGIALLGFASAGPALAAKSPPAVDPSRFVRSVTNHLFPLVPGTTYRYEGETEGVPTSTVTQVAHRTKTILGVVCTVVLDRNYEDGELIEDTEDWFAQDVDGNVWYFGEDTKELEDGHVVSTEGSWQAGVDGALPGIVMEADPHVGDRYRQELAEGVAEDMAQVIALDQEVSVPYGSFTGVLLTKEWTPLERGVFEEKAYAPGIGFVRAEMTVGGEERTELVSVSGP